MVQHSPRETGYRAERQKPRELGLSAQGHTAGRGRATIPAVWGLWTLQVLIRSTYLAWRESQVVRVGMKSAKSSQFSGFFWFISESVLLRILCRSRVYAIIMERD